MSHKNLKCAVISVSVLLILAAEICCHLILISYVAPQATEYAFESSEIRDEIKIVAISDLHDRQLGNDNRILVKEIDAQNPDALFLLGDMVNEYSSSADTIINIVKHYSDKIPVYCALGNHELGYMKNHPEFLSEVENAGAVVLDKEFIDVEIAGQILRIGGMYDCAFANDDYNSTKKENMNFETYSFLTDFENTEDFTIMMSHRPDSFIFGEASKTWNIDLVLSGHTHGGQVVLPFAGGVWGGDQGWFPEYDYGLFKKDLINICISRGLGTHKNAAPRFNNPPEIVLIKLK